MPSSSALDARFLRLGLDTAPSTPTRYRNIIIHPNTNAEQREIGQHGNGTGKVRTRSGRCCCRCIRIYGRSAVLSPKFGVLGVTSRFLWRSRWSRTSWHSRSHRTKYRCNCCGVFSVVPPRILAGSVWRFHPPSRRCTCDRCVLGSHEAKGVTLPAWRKRYVLSLYVTRISVHGYRSPVAESHEHGGSNEPWPQNGGEFGISVSKSPIGRTPIPWKSGVATSSLSISSSL